MPLGSALNLQFYLFAATALSPSAVFALSCLLGLVHVYSTILLPSHSSLHVKVGGRALQFIQPLISIPVCSTTLFEI